ncbi:SNF2 domain-containing protein CLASSY 3-like [Impatiens glandulifera]|uniref:SNF2 domain-containing protein CLASSY 3-like n=1 Tax=Impatiens glandulifera TaxID=253017 RepID=UPI001FB1017C|nr:SNF2 domain-containing protein CLASSY 3-like [Impatiens glandulifera]
MRKINVEAMNQTVEKSFSPNGGKQQCGSSADSCSVDIVEELISPSKIGTSNRNDHEITEDAEFLMVDCEGVAEKNGDSGVNLGEKLVSDEKVDHWYHHCDFSGESPAGNVSKPEIDDLSGFQLREIAVKCGISSPSSSSPDHINISSESEKEEKHIKRSVYGKDIDFELGTESSEEDDDDTSDEDFCPNKSSKSFRSNKLRADEVSMSFDRKMEIVNLEEDEDDEDGRSESENSESAEEEDEDEDSYSEEDFRPKVTSNYFGSNKLGTKEVHVSIKRKRVLKENKKNTMPIRVESSDEEDDVISIDEGFQPTRSSNYFCSNNLDTEDVHVNTKGKMVDENEKEESIKPIEVESTDEEDDHKSRYEDFHPNNLDTKEMHVSIKGKKAKEKVEKNKNEKRTMPIKVDRKNDKEKAKVGRKKKVPGLNISVPYEKKDGRQQSNKMAERLRSSQPKRRKINEPKTCVVNLTGDEQENVPAPAAHGWENEQENVAASAAHGWENEQENVAASAAHGWENEQENVAASAAHGWENEQENGPASADHGWENDTEKTNPQEEENDPEEENITIKTTPDAINDFKEDEQNVSSSNINKEDIWKGMHQMPLKKRHMAIEKPTAAKILVDSLWDQIDVPFSPFYEQDEEEIFEIPKNFGLEEYDAKPAEEKSYWDIEGEKLFEEMTFAMATEGIGWTHSKNTVGIDQTSAGKTVVSMLRNCGHGNHLLILDEQIGVRCKRCSYVEVEIRYMSPTFASNPWKRTNKKEFREERNNIGIHQLNMNFENGGSHLKEDIIDTAGTVWGLIPGLRQTMYAHQRDGFEFIWKNVEGSILLEDLKKDTSNGGGNGCIISHAPGTGKTRLTIMFIKSYLELYPTRKVVILAPLNMLLTWEDEFKKWKVNIPFHNMNRKDFSGQEMNSAVNLVKQYREQDKTSNRLVKLLSWKKEKGVLGMSYGLFETLAGDHGGKKKQASKNQIDISRVVTMLRELPDLLVLDEGHTPRNENSLIWKALSKVETQKRIILSGTPFQNNFRELYNTLRLVVPKFADKLILTKENDISGKQKRDKRETNVALNKWVSLTKGIAENDDDRIKELKDIIYRMAHVYKGDILKESLPGLRDLLVVLKPTDLQTEILNFVSKMKLGVLEREHCSSLTAVHPSLLIHSQLSGKEELSIYMPQLEAIKLNPEFGVKTTFVIDLIRLSQSLNEKVLIFSQFITPLTLIKDQLNSLFGWSEGNDMLYMDGAKDTKLRQLSITSFNNPDSTVKVMLASTKACSEGISLVGASRVVLLDVVWNPSVERQAISRAYRIGQKKLVYTYHLVAGEAENTKYSRQIQKDRLSKLVFSSANDNNADISEKVLMGTVVEDKILQEMIQHEKTCNMFVEIIDQEKESSLIDAHEVFVCATND